MANYIQPKFNEVLNRPYVIAQSNPDTSYSTYADSLLHGSDTSQAISSRLASDLLALINYEREKERLFISAVAKLYLASSNKEYQQLGQNLTSLSNAKYTSAALNLIQLARSGQYLTNNTQTGKTSTEKAQRFFELWQILGNKTIVKVIEKYHQLQDNSLLNESPESLYNHMIDDIALEWGQELKADYSTLFQAFNDAMEEALKTNEYMTNENLKKGVSAQGRYERAFKDWTDAEIQTAAKKYKADKRKFLKSENMGQRIAGVIYGFANGAIGEILPTIIGNGKVLGRSTIKLIMLSGKSQMTVAGKTDSFEILRITDLANIDLNNEQQFIKQLQNYAQHLDNNESIWDKSSNWLPATTGLLKELGDDWFAIHYSMKDPYSVLGSGSTVDPEKTGSWDSKLERLKQIASLTWGKDNNVRDLLWMVVNTGKNMILDGQAEQVSTLLASVAYSFMFEDYIEGFTQLIEQQSNQRIHLYFIEGYYYSVSDILQSLYDFSYGLARGSSRGRIANITLSPPKKDLSQDKKVQNAKGIDRWENLLKLTLANGQLGLDFKRQELINLMEKQLQTIK